MSSFCRCLVTGGPVLATEWAQSYEAMCQSLLLPTEDTLYLQKMEQSVWGVSHCVCLFCVGY